MHSSYFLFALLALVVARPAVEVSHAILPAWPGSSEHRVEEETESRYTEVGVAGALVPSESWGGLSGAACGRAFKAIKSNLNSKVPDNKLLPWQPRTHAWWKTNQNDLLQQIAIVHKVASDDFDDYVMWVADHPRVPDDQKNASYLAAQRIIDVVRASKIDGPWGAFHLVTRVSKWLLLNPKPVKKWKEACFLEESSNN